jgi:hypothetical protein
MANSLKKRNKQSCRRFAWTAPILVATTVIEVGIDVPDASVIIIYDAERLGWLNSISCGDVLVEPVKQVCATYLLKVQTTMFGRA